MRHTTAIALSLLISASAVAEPRDSVECRFTGTPVVIDGKADDVGWKHADVVDHFYLPWLGKNAHRADAATTARLLWDREYFYFFAELDILRFVVRIDELGKLLTALSQQRSRHHPTLIGIHILLAE